MVGELELYLEEQGFSIGLNELSREASRRGILPRRKARSEELPAAEHFKEHAAAIARRSSLPDVLENVLSSHPSPRGSGFYTPRRRGTIGGAGGGPMGTLPPLEVPPNTQRLQRPPSAPARSPDGQRRIIVPAPRDDADAPSQRQPPSAHPRSPDASPQTDRPPPPGCRLRRTDPALQRPEPREWQRRGSASARCATDVGGAADARPPPGARPPSAPATTPDRMRRGVGASEGARQPAPAARRWQRGRDLANLSTAAERVPVAPATLGESVASWVERHVRERAAQEGADASPGERRAKGRAEFAEALDEAVRRHEMEQAEKRRAAAAAEARAAAAASSSPHKRGAEWAKLRQVVNFQAKLRCSQRETAAAKAAEAEAAEAAAAEAAAAAEKEEEARREAARASAAAALAAPLGRDLPRRRWSATAAAVRAAVPAAALAAAPAAAPAAARPRDHRQTEVMRLHQVYEQELRAATGGGATARLRQLAVRSGGDGSFASVLRACYPQAAPREIRQMLEWLAPKKEGEAARSQLTLAQRIEARRHQRHLAEGRGGSGARLLRGRARAADAQVRALFDGYDADGSGSIELEELQQAGWGEEGTTEGAQIAEVFGRLDVAGSGSLNLEQFTELVEECSLFDRNFLANVHARHAEARARAQVQARRSTGTVERRPSLSDLSQVRWLSLDAAAEGREVSLEVLEDKMREQSARERQHSAMRTEADLAPAPSTSAVCESG